MSLKHLFESQMQDELYLLSRKVTNTTTLTESPNSNNNRPLFIWTFHGSSTTNYEPHDTTLAFMSWDLSWNYSQAHESEKKKLQQLMQTAIIEQKTKQVLEGTIKRRRQQSIYNIDNPISPNRFKLWLATISLFSVLYSQFLSFLYFTFQKFKQVHKSLI